MLGYLFLSFSIDAIKRLEALDVCMSVGVRECVILATVWKMD